MKRRTMRWVLACALVLVLAIGAGAQVASAQTLTVAQGADAVSLDPHQTNDQPSSRVMSQIYDTLIIQTEELELVPGLAESWTQLSDLEWEFKLRQGVKWHNGETFTANDVKFTFERLLNPPPGVAGTPAFLIEGIVSEIEVVDDYTLRIKTSVPFAPLLSHLAHTGTSILNEKAVTEAGADYGTTVVVGTGPYKFESWQSGSTITLVRNDEWWGGEAKSERIVFRAIPEGTVRAIELETGGVDIAYYLEPVDYARLVNHPDIKISSVETLSTAYIGFNASKPPFDDPRVRQAINYAIDNETMVDVVYEGRALPAKSPISPQVFGHNPDLKAYPYDPEKARQLLAEAGYPNGFSTSIWTNDNPLRVQFAEIVQAYLADVGIDVEVVVMEWGAYLDQTSAGNHDMFILGWVTVTADADYGLYALFHSSQYGDPGNRTFWSTPELDALLDKGRTSADPDERLAAYHRAQEIIAEEAPWIFLLVTLEDNGLRSNIEGFVPHPAGHHRLAQVVKN